MIQRIQSVYLLLTTLLSALFLTGNILTFKTAAGADITINIEGAWQLTGTGNREIIRDQIPAFVILVLIIMLSTATIFFYKKRKLQMKLSLAVIVLIVAFIGVLLFYALSIIINYHAVIVPGYKMFISALMLLSGILAYRGIRKDEDLVKSYDRLR
jgi:hypothetical protein